MKKIAIITIHFGTNHGSVLQAKGLCSYLLNEENKVSLIDYVPPRYQIWREYYSKKKQTYSLPVVIAFFPFYLCRELPNRVRFRLFLKKNLPLTRKVRSKDELKGLVEEYDVFMVGSDQVWNTDYNGLNERAYFLDFVDDQTPKVAYASSFGKSYPLDSERQFFLPYLKRFNYITVRESDGVLILRDWGINSDHVVDPVFLLSKNDWIDFAISKRNLQVFSFRYLLVYVMDGEYERLLDVAERVSKILSLKIIAISFTRIKDNRINLSLYKCDPKDFVGIISGAEFVVTNSFHGTAFSILFQKKFLTVEKEKYNSRMRSLLNRLQLCNRAIEVADDIELFDYEHAIDDRDVIEAQIVLQKWIIDSKQHLKTMLGN